MPLQSFLMRLSTHPWVIIGIGLIIVSKLAPFVCKSIHTNMKKADPLWDTKLFIEGASNAISFSLTFPKILKKKHCLNIAYFNLNQTLISIYIQKIHSFIWNHWFLSIKVSFFINEKWKTLFHYFWVQVLKSVPHD